MRNTKLYNVLDHINQFAFCDGKKSIFQSYDSVCCIIDRKKNLITFWKDRNYSKTTRKHLYAFLYDNNIWLYNWKDVENAIKDKEYRYYKVKYDNNLY